MTVGRPRESKIQKTPLLMILPGLSHIGHKIIWPAHGEFQIFKQGTFFTTLKTDLREFL